MRDRLFYRYRRTRDLLTRGLRSLRVRGLKASLAMLSPRLKQAAKHPELQFPGAADITALTQADFHCAAPKASIIIPVYNQCAVTQSCLASLQAQRGNIPFEIILVDDASTDHSFEFLSDLNGLRVFQMPQQSGYVNACNFGACQARGEMLVFLNNDTVVQAGWLEALLGTFEHFPNTGLAGAKLLFPNGRLQEAGGQIFSDGSVWNLGRFESAHEPRFNHVREVDYVSGAALAIRKELFDCLKGFDTHFAPGYFEDTDLAMRVRAQGLRVRYQPFACVVHQEGASAGTDTQSGMKAFQLPHQKKFHQRWQKELSKYPARPHTQLESKALWLHSPRKKILVIDEHTPRIDSDSGSLRLFHLMTSMKRSEHDVSFLPANLNYDKVHTVRLQQQGIACMYQPWAKNILAWLKENAAHFDSIIVCRIGLISSLYHSLRIYAPKTTLIFDTVDLHHIREQQEAELANSDALRKQAQTTKAKEYAYIRDCDETWVVSDSERKLLQTDFPDKTIRLISNSHPIRKNTPGFGQREGILFVGNFRHPPNADGLQWFLESIWPIVNSKNPDIRLNIIGADAPEQLQRMSEGKNVSFHGHVSDIEKHIDSARINIAPLRYGAGAKGKISQPLASGLPSIATRVAADGMHLVHGESILLADTAEAFANAIIRLYEDESQWILLSNNAYTIAEKHFSQTAIQNAIKT